MEQLYAVVSGQYDERQVELVTADRDLADEIVEWANREHGYEGPSEYGAFRVDDMISVAESLDDAIDTIGTYSPPKPYELPPPVYGPDLPPITATLSHEGWWTVVAALPTLQEI